MATECHACTRYGLPPCGATTRDGHVCTKHAGHKHDHVACLGNAHIVHRWSLAQMAPLGEATVDDAEALIRHAAEIIRRRAGVDLTEKLLAHVYCDECGDLIDQHGAGCGQCPPAEIEGDETTAYLLGMRSH